MPGPLPPKRTPHTDAYLALEQNLDYIADLLALRRRETLAAVASTRRLQTSIKKHAKLPPEKALKKLTDALARSKKTHDTLLARLETVTLWQVVILVTCVEAYIQDVLSAAASIDPTLMSKSENEAQHVAQYAEVVAATSLETLASTLRARWARGWLSSGGPTRWIFRLKQMGARGYPDDLAPRLERIWGIRHVAVHSAGIANAEFVRLHPGVVTGPGERVRLGHEEFKPFLGAVQEFVDTTERHFIARYPSLRVESSVGK